MTVDFVIQEEAEKLRKEEQERREQEEYLKLKESFIVEEEGEDAKDDETEVHTVTSMGGCYPYVNTPHHSGKGS